MLFFAVHCYDMLCCCMYSWQLSERQAGNRAYKQQQYTAALQHYQRALAVVNFVVGSSADEQAEVTANKGAVLLNIAAVHMAQQVGGLHACMCCCA
jgi:hypothetical protein